MNKLLPKIPCYFSLVGVFFLGLSFFTFPSQNGFIAQASFDPHCLEEIDFVLPQPAAYPLKIGDLDAPFLTATAAAVLDRDSGVFLFKKNVEKKVLPASTIKMMTALVSLDHFSLLQVLMVPQVNDEGQDMELVEGELITVEGLLYGLLVSSANDAAQVLAKNYPGGELAFVAAMNQKAQDLSLKKSFFTNPTGLDNDEFEKQKKSLSSAQDLAWLADYGLKNDFFQKVVATKKVTLRDPQGRFVHPLSNLNQLLWTVPGVRGVKTGWTEEARECLVTQVEREDHRLLAVVLGSEDRFGETKSLIDWIFENFEWREIILSPPPTRY